MRFFKYDAHICIHITLQNLDTIEIYFYKVKIFKETYGNKWTQK